MLSLEKQEAYRQRYASERPDWKPATHRYLERVTRHLTPHTHVLDLGCGRGGIVEQLRGQLGFVAGLDPDLTSLREHRASLIHRTCGVAERLPYRDGAFDLVTCSWVLEHLEHPGRICAEIARVLAPGGHVVFVTPNRRHPLLALNRLLGWTRGRLVDRLYGRESADTFPAFYRANTPRAIARLMERAGLVDVTLDMVEDPSYLAFNAPLYRLSTWVERAMPARGRVHIVGEARR